MWSEKPSTHIQLSVNLLTLRCTGYNWINYAFPFYWHNRNYIQAMVSLSRWTCNHTWHQYPERHFGNPKKKKKEKKAFVDVFVKWSLINQSYLLFVRTHPQYSEEKVPHPRKLRIMSKVQTWPSKWFAEPTNMEVVLGSTDIGLVKVESITLMCVQKERMLVYLTTHQSIALVLNPKP